MFLTEPRRAPLRRRVWRTAAALSTPLVPADYLSLVDPLVGSSGLRARVQEVHREAAGAATLVLRPGPGWAGHRAGQWIRLGASIRGVLHWRSYSLTAPPDPRGLIRVTVVPAGPVSRHLAGAVRPGEVLRLEQAAGAFVLPDPLPDRLLFVTAGSGITPVVGMLRELASRGPLPDVVLLHSARTRGDVVLGADLRALAAASPGLRLVERHTAVAGRLTPAQLPDLVPDWSRRTAWACGPAGLLDALEAHWQGHGVRALLRTERFAPSLVALSDASGGTVTFGRTGASARSDGTRPLLEDGEDAGVLLPSGCRMGICFGCVVPLRSGQVRDVRTGATREAGELVQTCISTPVGDVELDV